VRPIVLLLALPIPLSCSEHPKVIVGSTLDCSKLVHRVRPVYPKEAKKMRVQGTVRVRVLITKAGNPTNIEVLKGDPLLVPAALTAVKKWRYTPCLINGEAVDWATVLDIGFNLNQ
jgi:periplasmic protein TonB